MKALLKYRNTRGLSCTNRNTDKSFFTDKDKKNVRSPHAMVQPKLELTTPGDSHEQEADRMADFVMRKAFSGNSGIPTEHPSQTSALPPVISRQTDGVSSGIAIDSATENSINASRGGGQPLPDTLRTKMESGFGADFSGVRLHTGSQAAGLSNTLKAKAFAYGNDIFFNSGQYNPQSATGQHLIAHELTHVMQQSGKVGREEINYCPLLSVYDRLEFSLKDTNYYNTLAAQSTATLQQLRQEPAKAKDGISVAFVISKAADHNGAFRDMNYDQLREVIVLQASSTKECEQLLRESEKVGPLKNLIISGHGDESRITLGKAEFVIDPGSGNYSATIDFFKAANELFDRARTEHGIKGQVIYLDACLTNSHLLTTDRCSMNFAEVFQQEVGSSVRVFANSASSYDQDVTINNDGSLDVKDPGDPSILNRNSVNGNYSNMPPTPSSPGSNVYVGNEIIGRTRAVGDEFLLNGNFDRLTLQLEEMIRIIRDGKIKCYSSEQEWLEKAWYLRYLRYLKEVVEKIRQYIDKHKIEDKIANDSYFLIMQLIIALLNGFDRIAFYFNGSIWKTLPPDIVIKEISKRWLQGKDDDLLRKINNSIDQIPLICEKEATMSIANNKKL